MISIDTSDAEINAVLRNVEAMVGRIRSAVQNVITRYAYLMARTAKGNAPFKSGNLRSKIEAIIERFAARVLADTKYAAAVELGRTDLPNYPTQPYLAPAFEQHKAGFLRDLRAAVESGGRGEGASAGAAL